MDKSAASPGTDKAGLNEKVLAQKNPPAYPVPPVHLDRHDCSINSQGVEDYRFSVECSCSWRMHAKTMEEALKLKDSHVSNH